MPRWSAAGRRRAGTSRSGPTDEGHDRSGASDASEARGKRRTRRALLPVLGLVVLVAGAATVRSYRDGDPLHRSLADRVVTLDQVPSDPTLQALDDAHLVLNATIWGDVEWTPHVAADEACEHLTVASRTAGARGSRIDQTTVSAIRELRDYSCHTPSDAVSLLKIHNDSERLYHATVEALR